VQSWPIPCCEVTNHAEQIGPGLNERNTLQGNEVQIARFGRTVRPIFACHGIRSLPGTRAASKGARLTRHAQNRLDAPLLRRMNEGARREIPTVAGRDLNFATRLPEFRRLSVTPSWSSPARGQALTQARQRRRPNGRSPPAIAQPYRRCSAAEYAGRSRRSRS